MAAIDHLVFTSPSLERGIEHVAALTGVTAVPGGAHPGRGTHNALAAFDDATYLEIIGIDPDQAEPVGSRPFGLTPQSELRLVTFAVRPTGDESIEQLAVWFRSRGFLPGRIVPMSRTRPDGMQLRWRLTMSATPMADGIVPFLIDWGDTPSPAPMLPPLGALLALHATHPLPAARKLLSSLDSRIVATDGPAGLVAGIQTGAGPVTLR